MQISKDFLNSKFRVLHEHSEKHFNPAKTGSSRSRPLSTVLLTDQSLFWYFAVSMDSKRIGFV